MTVISTVHIQIVVGMMYDCFVFVSCYLVLLHDIIHGDIARTGCYVVLSVFELPKLQPDL